MFKKVCAIAFAIVCCAIMTTSCSVLPAYNLTNDGDPAEAVEDFLDAVISGDNSDIGDLIYNYSWQSNQADNTSNDTIISDSDLKLLNLVRKSRDYSIINQSEDSRNGLYATVTVDYTGLDIGKFREKLTDDVLTEVTRIRNEGGTFNSPHDTSGIIERHKTELLKNPEKFYTTRQYEVELMSSEGRWRILLSEEFYNALSGYFL